MAGISVSLDGANIQLSFQKDDQATAVVMDARAARALVRAVVPHIGAPRGACPAGCDRALDHAIITAPEQRDPALLERLAVVAGRALKAA